LGRQQDNGRTTPNPKTECIASGICRHAANSDTALGDWYVNRVVVDRRPLLLLVSAATLLPILIPARDVRTLPDRLAGIVDARLQRCGIDAAVIEAEINAMSSVAVGSTVDRSVLGILVDFAKCVSFHLEQGHWDDRMLPAVEARLAETPCYASGPDSGVIFPERKAPEALMSKWLANLPLQPTSGRAVH
jgi:hypothetical protein